METRYIYIYIYLYIYICTHTQHTLPKNLLARTQVRIVKGTLETESRMRMREKKQSKVSVRVHKTRASE